MKHVHDRSLGIAIPHAMTARVRPPYVVSVNPSPAHVVLRQSSVATHGDRGSSQHACHTHMRFEHPATRSCSSRARESTI